MLCPRGSTGSRSSAVERAQRQTENSDWWRRCLSSLLSGCCGRSLHSFFGFLTTAKRDLQRHRFCPRAAQPRARFRPLGCWRHGRTRLAGVFQRVCRAKLHDHVAVQFMPPSFAGPSWTELTNAPSVLSSPKPSARSCREVLDTHAQPAATGFAEFTQLIDYAGDHV